MDGSAPFAGYTRIHSVTHKTLRNFNASASLVSAHSLAEEKEGISN